jgi:hypothetical protein
VSGGGDGGFVQGLGGGGFSPVVDNMWSSVSEVSGGRDGLWVL